MLARPKRGEGKSEELWKQLTVRCSTKLKQILSFHGAVLVPTIVEAVSGAKFTITERKRMTKEPNEIRVCKRHIVSFAGNEPCGICGAGPSAETGGEKDDESSGIPPDVWLDGGTQMCCNRACSKYSPVASITCRRCRVGSVALAESSLSADLEIARQKIVDQYETRHADLKADYQTATSPELLPTQPCVHCGQQVSAEMDFSIVRLHESGECAPTQLDKEK